MNPKMIIPNHQILDKVCKKAKRKETGRYTKADIKEM